MEKPIPAIQLILAQNIKEARSRLGYSQQELAERADLSAGHMNDLEQGRKWVSADTLQRLADALAMEPFMLLLPEGHENHIETFTVLTEYAKTLRKSLEEVVDTSLREVLRLHGDSRSSE